MSEPLDEPSDLDRLVIALETARAGYERGRIAYLRSAVVMCGVALFLAADALWVLFHG